MKILSRRTILRSAIFIAALSGAAATDSALAALPKTAVVLGDSFSSGEGGRWAGNSFTGIDGGDRAQTDTAALDVNGGWGYYLQIPYEADSIANGCNRSNWAPITYLKYHAGLYPEGYAEVVNLACSGARNKNLWPAPAGGVSWKGETPQIPKLATIAQDHDIDLIVLGVGGNDMGFSNTIEACITAWVKKHWTLWDDNASCIGDIKGDTLPRLGDVWYKTTKTIGEIRSQMQAIGDTNYKIVLMGYPAIIPRGNKYRYDAGDRRIRNCPFNGPDSDFIDDVLLPKLNATMEAIADQEGVDFINLHQVFNGHRLCEAGFGTRMVDSNTPANYNTEWVRYLDTVGTSANSYLSLVAELTGQSDDSVFWEYLAGDQGSLSESLHPNKYGQQAIGNCLREYRAKQTFGSKGYTCQGGGSGYASDMAVSSLPNPSGYFTWISYAIPDGTGSSLTVSGYVSTVGEPGKVMRTSLNIDHARKGQLKITVKAPSGKEYLVKNFNQYDSGAFPSKWNSFFFDAPAENGYWKLIIHDQTAGYSGTLRSWGMELY